MNSSDVRIVRLIPTTADGSFTRASDATYYDGAGVLQTAPANTLRVTYDPSDLSKAPYALIEPEATNHIRNNTMQGAVAGTPGTAPTYWQPVVQSGVSSQIVGVGVEAGINYLDVRFVGIPATSNNLAIYFETPTGAPATQGQRFEGSAYLRLIAGTSAGIRECIFVSDEISSGGAYIGGGVSVFDFPDDRPLAQQLVTTAYQMANPQAAYLRPYIAFRVTSGQPVDFTIRIGLPQLARDKVPRFPIKTSGAAVTRAADVVGPGAGLVYSNVPITEPLWAAGTYAKGAKVRDAQNFVFESLVDGNTAPLTDTTKTKWLPLGITNRWKVFDQAVNSQTSAPGRLTFAVKPGAVATTMMLLNMEGASVTVGQTESGYVRTKSLVSHEVDNWYDFYYEEPVRAGDAVFTDIPPFPNAMLTVSIDNGPLEAKIGACLIGKPMVIGKATASFKAGVLSYSTSTADTFGNITMVKRYNAPRMNFDVMIPAGSESVVYRILREYTDTEIGIIVGDSLSMGIGYGYLGQWDVPKSGSGRTAPIEFKGLV